MMHKTIHLYPEESLVSRNIETAAGPLEQGWKVQQSFSIDPNGCNQHQLSVNRKNRHCLQNCCCN